MAASSQTAASVPKASFSLSVAISIAALLISASSLYFSQLRVAHSLKLIIANPDMLDPQRSEDVFLSRLVFANQGNRSETVLYARVILRSSPGEYTWSKTSVSGPYVVKPGEVQPLSFNWQLTKDTIEDIGNWSGEQGSQVATGIIQIEIAAIGPDGKDVIRTVSLAEIIFDEACDQFTQSDFKSRPNVIELLENVPSTPFVDSGSFTTACGNTIVRPVASGETKISPPATLP